MLMISKFDIHATNQLQSSLETVPIEQKSYNNKDEKLTFIASRELSFVLIEQLKVPSFS